LARRFPKVSTAKRWQNIEEVGQTKRNKEGTERGGFETEKFHGNSKLGKVMWGPLMANETESQGHTNNGPRRNIKQGEETNHAFCMRSKKDVRRRPAGHHHTPGWKCAIGEKLSSKER